MYAPEDLLMPGFMDLVADHIPWIHDAQLAGAISVPEAIELQQFLAGYSDTPGRNFTPFPPHLYEVAARIQLWQMPASRTLH